MKNKTLVRQLGLDVGLVLAKNFLNTEYMHYGYWTEEQKVCISNLHDAQENYMNLLLESVPEGTRTILDVGCGVGACAQKFLDAGFEVDCVCPNPYLMHLARERLRNRVAYFECLFEEIEYDRRYDLLLFAESFHYVDMKVVFEKASRILNPDGHILICDMFKKNVEGKSPIAGGHHLDRFHESVNTSGFTILKDEDITRQTAPSLDIMNQILMDVAQPIWSSVGKFMKAAYPRISTILAWRFKDDIDKVHRKYFSGQTNSDQFSNFKSYRLIVMKGCSVMPESGGRSGDEGSDNRDSDIH